MPADYSSTVWMATLQLYRIHGNPRDSRRALSRITPGVNKLLKLNKLDGVAPLVADPPDANSTTETDTHL